MHFKIRNIGKIGYADIVIDGLTMIAGENNTGKSTVGKALFCFLHGLNRWDEHYIDECGQYIFDIVLHNIKKLDAIFGSNHAPTISEIKKLVGDFFQRPEIIKKFTDEQRCVRTGDIITSAHPLMTEFDEFIGRYALLFKGDNVTSLLSNKADEIDNWKRNVINNICDGKTMLEENMQADYIEENFKLYFSGQYRSMYLHNENSFCMVEDEKECSRIDLWDSGCDMEQAYHTRNRVFFIDSPVAYDRMAIYGESVRGNSAQELVDNILVPNFELMKGEKRIGEIPSYNDGLKWSKDICEKVESLLEEVRELMGGASDWNKEGFRFSERNNLGSIQPHNVSTGVKHLALVEYILHKRLINPGDILILDEPEINVHPEWQLSYSKLLVLLEKNLGVRIIITTHSPFFIRAVECYTDYYNEMDKLNIYRSRLDEMGRALFDNVMESEWGTPLLYEDYSKQYDKLQGLLDEKYGTMDEG